ncbi:MAG: polysaccharide deacetylase family protein [Thermoproteota archaeon]|nr:polysaccharide deacetylase family protein [Candidatus Bathyarchaeota archaeon]
MTLRDLRIGIRKDYRPWSDRIAWLIGLEFGYPFELVMGEPNTPILVEPDSAISRDVDSLLKYLKSGGSILISHDSKFIGTVEPLEGFPVTFGGVKRIQGKGIVNVLNPLARFFQYYSLGLGNVSLDVELRETKCPTQEHIVFYLSENEFNHPLLICGQFKALRYAVITLGDKDIETLRCAPLMYLTALHYLLSDKPFIRKSFWKNEKRSVVILTFDFEGLAKYSNIKRYWWWNRCFDEILLRIGISPILRFLREKRIPSTWFMLGSQVSSNPRICEKLAKEKLIEIAGHGDMHQGIDKSAQRFDKQSSEVQYQRILIMKKMIEDMLSTSIEGFRAPGLYANVDTLMALEDGGFKWDSSASPQSNLPFREFPWPFNYVYNWEKGEMGRLVEIPVQAPWDRWCPLHKRFHSTEEYEKEIRQGFEDMLFIGGVQVLLIHPYELLKYPGYWKAVERHVERLLKKSDVEITTCGKIAQDWMQRDEMLIQASFDENSKLVHVKVENGQPGLTLFVHIPEQLRIRRIVNDAGTPIPYTLWSDLGGAVFSVKANTEEFMIQLEPNPS